MILYLDTSALVKKYFKEPGSIEVIAKWKQAAEIATSSVAYAELTDSVYRKQREADLSTELLDVLINSFKKDWLAFIRVQVTDDLNRWIDRVVVKSPLRGFDAIHLASALMIDETLSEHILFACFNRRLLLAAQAEGLETFPNHL